MVTAAAAAAAAAAACGRHSILLQVADNWNVRLDSLCPWPQDLDMLQSYLSSPASMVYSKIHSESVAIKIYVSPLIRQNFYRSALARLAGIFLFPAIGRRTLICWRATYRLLPPLLTWLQRGRHRLVTVHREHKGTLHVSDTSHVRDTSHVSHIS